MRILLSSIFSLFLSAASIMGAPEEKGEAVKNEKKVESPAPSVDTVSKTEASKELAIKGVPVDVLKTSTGLSEKLDEVLQVIQKEFPVGMKRLTKARENLAFKYLIAKMFNGVEYFPSEESLLKARPAKQAGDSEKVVEAKLFPGVIIAGNTVSYFRIDGFNPKQFEQLEADCAIISRLANQPSGVLIDLRNCQGGNLEDVYKSARLFCSADRFSKETLGKGVKRYFKRPVVLLLGRRCKGMAEIFAVLMARNSRCVTIGENTAGELFKKKKMTLSDGSILLVPSVPQYLLGFNEPMVTPSIKVSAYPQISYENIRGEIGGENRDACVERAADLFTCLEALEKQ